VHVQADPRQSTPVTPKRASPAEPVSILARSNLLNLLWGSAANWRETDRAIVLRVRKYPLPATGGDYCALASHGRRAALEGRQADWRRPPRRPKNTSPAAQNKWAAKYAAWPNSCARGRRPAQFDAVIEQRASASEGVPLTPTRLRHTSSSPPPCPFAARGSATHSAVLGLARQRSGAARHANNAAQRAEPACPD